MALNVRLGWGLEIFLLIEVNESQVAALLLSKWPLHGMFAETCGLCFLPQDRRLRILCLLCDSAVSVFEGLFTSEAQREPTATSIKRRASSRAWIALIPIVIWLARNIRLLSGQSSVIRRNTLTSWPGSGGPKNTLMSQLPSGRLIFILAITSLALPCHFCKISKNRSGPDSGQRLEFTPMTERTVKPPSMLAKPCRTSGAQRT